MYKGSDRSLQVHPRVCEHSITFLYLKNAGLNHSEVSDPPLDREVLCNMLYFEEAGQVLDASCHNMLNWRTAQITLSLITNAALGLLAMCADRNTSYLALWSEVSLRVSAILYHSCICLKEQTRFLYMLIRLRDSPIEIFFVIHWHDPDGLSRSCLSPCSRTGRGRVANLGGQEGLNIIWRYIGYTTECI